MSLSKKSLQRRADIFAAAQKLFAQQGFDATSISQITREAGVAKGTFYYYFDSKEEAFAHTMAELDDSEQQLLRPVLEDASLDAHSCLYQVLENLRSFFGIGRCRTPKPHSMIDELTCYKGLVRSVHSLAPLLSSVFEKGVREGVFNTPHPHALAEQVLTVGHFLLDGDLFPTCEDTWRARLSVFQQNLEQGLGITPGSLSYIREWDVEQEAPPAS